jgi:predicted ATPase with chaperone activity
MRNACPCDYFDDLVKACTCSAGTVTKYQKRISGPLLDRIDNPLPYVDENLHAAVAAIGARLSPPAKLVHTIAALAEA